MSHFHYVRYDEPNAKTRLARAVCGQLVNPQREHSVTPDCEQCQAWLQWYDALNLGQDDPPTVSHG
jgi:hypothetical protein